MSCYVWNREDELLSKNSSNLCLLCQNATTASLSTSSDSNSVLLCNHGTSFFWKIIDEFQWFVGVNTFFTDLLISQFLRYRTFSPPGTDAKYCDKRVYLSVCPSVYLSVRSHISKTTCPNFIRFLLRDAMLAQIMLSSCVRPSVTNTKLAEPIGSRKQRRTIAQGL